jgi:hypothetical protein
MAMRIALVCLSFAALAGCAAGEQQHAASDAADPSCAEIATTGDMYRYCLEVGPQQALMERDAASDTAQAVLVPIPPRPSR